MSQDRRGFDLLTGLTIFQAWCYSGPFKTRVILKKLFTQNTGELVVHLEGSNASVLTFLPPLDSVVSLDFCSELPHLLAVGMYDGSVAIYDIREKGEKPFLESAHSTGKVRTAVLLNWLS